jgi:hypothetical protein
MTTTTFNSTELFGGAMVVDLPSGFADVRCAVFRSLTWLLPLFVTLLCPTPAPMMSFLNNAHGSSVANASAAILWILPDLALCSMLSQRGLVFDMRVLQDRLTSSKPVISVKSPDHQEVYLDKDGFASISFDLTERVDSVPNDEEALKYHLEDIIEPGAVTDLVLESCQDAESSVSTVTEARLQFQVAELGTEAVRPHTRYSQPSIQRQIRELQGQYQTSRVSCSPS